MEHKFMPCKSCGMPLENDPGKGGTNVDKSKTDKYCSFCYKNGKFNDEGISLKKKIEKNIQINMAKMNISEEQARVIAERILPNLERWKNNV